MKDLKDMSLAELWELFPIVLQEHNPDYTEWYEEEQAILFDTLKNYGVFRISHIGSTSIQGLVAKPIVDILLELENGYNKEAVVDVLQDNGWLVMAQDDSAQTIDLNKGYTLKGFAEKVYHLHIKPAGDWGELYFRDYLRKHSDVAGEYERLKLRLKEKFEHNRDAYTDAKSNFIQQHTQTARKEFGNRYCPSLSGSNSFCPTFSPTY